MTDRQDMILGILIFVVLFWSVMSSTPRFCVAAGC